MKYLLSIMALLALLLNVRADEYQLNVGQFRKVSVSDSINVVYRCVPDSTGTVYFQADRKYADAVLYSVAKGELKISVSTEYVNDPGLPTVYVYSDYLNQVTNSGTGVVTVDNPAPCPEFKATLIGNGSINVNNVQATEVLGKITTGNGTITMSGKCTEAKLQMLGTGLIQADLLESQVVNCKAMGGGSIGCWPVSTLKVQCLGSTKIYYKGEPTIRKKGGGKVIPIE